MAPTIPGRPPAWRVTVYGTTTDLPFRTEEAARAEFADRCDQGQKAYLWQWFNATAEADAGYDVVRGWRDVEADQDARRFNALQPWPSEDDDMSRARGCEADR